MVLDRAKGELYHRNFRDIAEYLNARDMLVLNNTKVLPARVFGIREKTGARIEFLLLKREDNVFSVMVKPAKRFEPGEGIIFGENGAGLRAKIADKNKIAFEAGGCDKVYKFGTMPLPPYIKRDSEGLDFERYQTVFAREDGSIAAPTAGLHFSNGLLENIKEKGVEISYITLHVGAGTFRPVKEEDITKHKMDEEYFEVEAKTIEKTREAKTDGRRIFAVGTTSARTLETMGALPVTQRGFTNLFIYPGYKFKVVDALLTNFHLPKSTLFMLVCAFAGIGLARRAYSQAIEQKYNFYSYGDAMLII